MPCPVDPHLISGVPPPWRRATVALSALLVILVFSSYPAMAQDRTLATFYGAYQRIKTSRTVGEFNLELNFKTSSPSGLLLVARIDRNSSNVGYLGVGLQNRHLVVVLKESAAPVSVMSETPIHLDEWYYVSIVLQSNEFSFNSSLRGNTTFSFNVSLTSLSLVAVRDVFLGGANNFFAGAFSNLPITEYFVGCLANCSIDGKNVRFAPKVTGYGMDYGCCPNPEPISWNFTSSHSNSLVFETRLSHERFQTNTLVVSFRIQARHDGMVFYTDDDSNNNHHFALAVELYNGQLVVHVTNEGNNLENYSLVCSGTLVDSWNHEVSIYVSQTLLSCAVDGNLMIMNISLPLLPTSSIQYHIGSANVSTLSPRLHLFHSDLYTIPNNGLFPSFGGSLQKFSLNGLEAAPSSLEETHPSFSSACPEESENIPGCQLIRERVSLAQLLSVTVISSVVSVKENKTVRLTDQAIVIQIPDDIIESDTRNALVSLLRFTVVSNPQHGALVNSSNPGYPVVSMTYADMQAGLLEYHHHGEQIPSDYLTFNVTSDCSSSVDLSLVVNITVELTNDPPVVTQLGTLSIAVGTRKVISSNVVSVEDEETQNLVSISFKVVQIHVDGCGGTKLCMPAGRIERSPGSNLTYFNQQEINNGEILFQHIPEFGNQTLTITLRASDQHGIPVMIYIPVVPHDGHVTLVVNRPLDTVQGRCVHITNTHLFANTDFNYQNPILEYSVTMAPHHGRLEVYYQSLWIPLGANIDFEGFTQDNVNHKYVRYCHNNNSLETDSFEFQLNSTLLLGERGNFTINVLSYSNLSKPNITVATAPLQLSEGGNGTFSKEILNVSLAQEIRIPWSGELIQISNFSFFFRVDTLPQYGEIYMDEERLQKTEGFNLTQLVQGGVEYRHDNSENHEDSISIRVEALNMENLPLQYPHFSSVTNINISITPVNNHTPFIQTSQITVAEGLFVTLSPEILNITDDDQPMEIITVTISNQDLNHGYFSYVHTASPVSLFTTDDIINERIDFRHKLNVSLPLTHTITMEVSDGLHSSQKEIVIEVTPLVIDISDVNLGECIVELDAESEALSAQVSSNVFQRVRILDQNGEDANRLHYIIFSVTQRPVYGDFWLGNTSVHTFKVENLQDGLVMYNLRNITNRNTADWVSVKILYGHSDTVDMEMKICINPVAAPNRTGEISRSLTIDGDVSIVISNEIFNEVDTRGRGGNAIVYKIIRAPRYGRIHDHNNVMLTNFTQSDIDRSLVYYQHVNKSSSTLEDSFIVEVCTPYLCRSTYHIDVAFSVNNLTVNNNGLSVREGETIVITKANLDAISPDGRNLRIHIPRSPTAGLVILNSGGVTYPAPEYFDVQDIASGMVSYHHSGSETLKDNFTFFVSHNGEKITEIFLINIIPINNNPPELTSKKFSVIARTTRNITTNDLQAYDQDSNIHSRDLLYVVLNHPAVGYIHFRNNTHPNSSLQEWYEDDIRMNRLAYTHTNPIGREGTLDIIGINLCDQDRCVTDFITIHIYEIQLILKVNWLPQFIVMEGGNNTIDVNFLSAAANGDDNLVDSDFKFHTTVPPRHGTLLLNGRPVTNFTMADITSSSLVYQHDHSNTVSDSFDFNVTIPKHEATSSDTFKIVIDPVDDDPPVLVFRHQPFLIVEGSNFPYFNESLEVIDFDTNMNLVSQTSKIEFHIVTDPTNGRVTRSNNGIYRQTRVFTLLNVHSHSVLYESLTRPVNWFDSFIVRLNDANNVQPTLYNFTFVILPNTVPVHVSPFWVNEGMTVIVPADTIVTLHPYLSNQAGDIIIKDGPSNGSFIDRETGNTLLNFTTEDLMAQRVLYLHNDAENEKDTVKFEYEAYPSVSSNNVSTTRPYPETYKRTSGVVSLDILINTRNDRGPEIRTDPRMKLTMWAGDCAFLTTEHLDVFDADTPDSKVTYTFNFTSIDAYISDINNTNNDPIQTFTQEDVTNSLIKLFHHNGTGGKMSYTVTDSQFFNYGELVIETHQLEILVLRNNPLSVSMNGKVVITQSSLDVSMSDVNSTISRCFPNETIWYHFEAKYGIIIVNGTTNATSFTDSDVKAGHVIYQHTRPDIWEPLETLTLRARATLTKFKEFQLNITINLPSEPDSPLAVHKNLSVVEGSRTCLSEEILDARNIRYRNTNDTQNTFVSWFEFKFEDSHGEILLDGERPPGNPPRVTQDQIALGSVCYQHSGAENTSDTIVFYVIIRDSDDYIWGRTKHLNLYISVTLINDESPVVLSSSLSMPVVEGFYSYITNASLLIVDEDNPASDLFFTIKNFPPGGHLLLNNTKLLEGYRFGQVDVNEGWLRFEALDVGEWTTRLEFGDGKFRNFTNFTITIEEHFIKIVETKTVSYLQNQNGTRLSIDHITTRTNGDDSDTVYTIVEYPKHGELKGLKDGKNFTHNDLLARSIEYVPIHFRTHSDSFYVNVTNREAEMQSVEMKVRVEVWGKVKQNATLDFESGTLSLALPKKILQLNDLQLYMQRPPVITVLQQPKLGYIEVKYPTSLRKKRSTSVTPTRKFTYDFLSYDWVYYTWNTSNATLDIVPNDGINDHFTILVEGYESVQPGEANITINILNPPLIFVPPESLTDPPTFYETPTVVSEVSDDSNSGGFTPFALVPIVGIIICLLVIILGVVIFCVTQQGRIRKKLQPKMPRSRPVTHVPLHTYPASYDMDLGVHGEAVTSLNDGMEYRDSHSPLSARHSPLTRYSPLVASHPPASAVYPQPSSDRYHQLHRHMVPRPRSRRSNVSVSYSHHRPLSEVTLDDMPHGCQLEFSPPPLAVGIPNPLRPSGRNSSAYDEGEEESGYLSTPNPSIVADEPIRLVLRRPAVEEVSPLPREGPANEAVEEEEEEEPERSGEDENEDEIEPHPHESDKDEGDAEEAEKLTASPIPQLEEEDNGQTSEEEEKEDEQMLAGPQEIRKENRKLLSEEHGYNTPPPDQQNLPLLPPSPCRPDTSTSVPAPNGLNAPSPTDLQTIFRTHNPILKSTEYWV